jgi:FKBP-type peptidyl-prolyl cis-trans isomerase FklB
MEEVMRVRLSIWIIVLFVLSATVPLFAQDKAPLTDKKDRASYMIGVDIGTSLKKQGVDVNVDVLRDGLRDAIAGAKLLLSEEDMAQIKVALTQEVAEAKTKALQVLAEKNKKEEEQFLAENKKKEGVVSRPSGLQYMILKEGTGKTPALEDTVSVHYRVSTIDGNELEDSTKKGTPATFVLEDVIPGWKEGVSLMKTGSKWRLFVPSALAYGEEGAGESLGPNTMMVFELELLSIAEKLAEAPADKAVDASVAKGEEKASDKAPEKKADGSAPGAAK